MELRWYTTYNEHGLDSETELQYRESEDDEWEAVPYVRVREMPPEDYE